MSYGAKSVKNPQTLELFLKLATEREKRMISLREKIYSLLGELSRGGQIGA